MKATWILRFFAGIVLGGGGVFIGLRQIGPSSASIQAESGQTTAVRDNVDTGATDPFESSEENPSENGLILSDPESITERHLCIALWYAEYSVEGFGKAVGHEFSPVGKERSPVEILEEHLEFMKSFMAETQRLEKQSGVDGPGER